MRTITKIKLARWASRLLVQSRRWVGKGPTTTVFRRGLKWHLDLTEGIELAIYLLGSFDPATARACERHVAPGSTVLDVGANIGAYTLPLARRVGDRGQIVAIEPTAYAYQRLLHNLALNPRLESRVRPVRALLVSEPSVGHAGAVLSRWPLAMESLSHPDHGGLATSIEGAEIASLDEIVRTLGLEGIDFVKLDTDGSEYDVLLGSRELLEDRKPWLLMELAPYAFKPPGSSFEQMIDLVRSHGYTFFRLDGKTALPEDSTRIAESIRHGAVINALAIPNNSNSARGRG